MKKLSLYVSLLTLMLGLAACQKGCKKDQGNAPAQDSAPIKEKEPEHVMPGEQKQENPEKENDRKQLMNELQLNEGDKLYAVFETTEGTIKAELFWDKVPTTVRNFVELAQGKKEWIDPNSNEKTTKPLYNGSIFHRVIKGFMIQGGDPTGTGMGGPGYRFKDEFHPDLKHVAGALSMANAGPNTNGSQFFFMEEPKGHLDNRHSVFGLADQASLAIINKIASLPTNKENDKPLTNVTIKNVTITKEAKQPGSAT